MTPLMRDIIRLLGAPLPITSDGEITTISTGRGVALSMPSTGSVLGMVTGGSNPYSWRSVVFTDQGGIELMLTADGAVAGSVTDSYAGYSVPAEAAAWERNGNRSVYPGTVAWFTPRAAVGEDVPYDFAAPPEEVIFARVARIDPDARPETRVRLSADLLWDDTVAAVDYPERLPAGRGFYFMLADAPWDQAEVLWTDGVSGGVLTGLRHGQHGTRVWYRHTAPATIVWDAVYEWVEVVPRNEPGGGPGHDPRYVDREHGRYGSLASGVLAGELCGWFTVPDGTIVALRRGPWRVNPGITARLDSAADPDQTTMTFAGGTLGSGLPTGQRQLLLLIDGEIVRVLG